MEDNLKSIYDYLSSKGGQGSYEEFVDFFNANDDNKHTIYDYMAKEGGQGSYEEFLAFAGTPQRVDVSDVEEANQPNVVTLSEEELTPANVGNYTSRSGVSELKSPKELEASAQLNANKPLYSEWVKGVDADRLNDNYDLEKAYNLLPYEQMETWRTDTTGETHLPSVADNLKTGTVDFLKRKDHPSLQEELDWYNSDEPSAKKFRDEGWKLDDSGDYYKYVKSEPQMIEKAAQYNIPTEYSPGNYEQVTQRIADLDAERSKIEKRLDLAYDVMLDTDIEPSWVEKDNERLAALNDERNALNEYTKAYGQPHDDYEQQIGKAFSSIDTDNVAEQAWNHAEQLTAEATEKDYENMLSGNKYTAFGQAMIASNPELTGAQSIKNMANRLTYHDLKVMADDAWEKLGEEKQEAVAGEIANVLRTYYPEAEDSAIQDASRKIARQQSDQRMYQLAVEKNTPKNTTEYFFRKAVEANSVFKIMDALARSIAGTTGDMQAKEEAMQNFNSGWKTVLNVGGTVTGMVTDPLMYVSGAVGNVATKGVGAGASAIFGRSSVNKFGTTLGGKIAAGAIGGGFNLGTYEAGGEALNQLRWGGDIKGIDDNGYYIIGDYSGKKIARGFGHGFVMGGTIGVIAPTLGNISDNLVRATSNTGGKVALRAGELGMSTVAEGTVFSIPEFYNTYQQYEELIDSYSNENSPNYIADENKRAQAIDAAISKRKGAMMDVWTDNMAMMAGFKIKSVGQRLGELKSYPNSKAGFETRLRAVLDGSPDLALTKEEKDELVSRGYSDLKELTDAYDSRFQAKEKLPSTVTAEEGGALPVNRFMEMMNDNTISESARAKMYFYITGNVLPMSTIMGGKVIPGEDANGKATFTVQSLGMNGVVTSKTFTSEKAAQAEMERISRQTELNLADAGERWYNYRNFELGKKNATEKLRKDIYNKYYVNIDDAIRKEPNRRSKMEADAIKEYLNTLWADQIEKQAQASWERKQAEADIERIKAAGDELADDLAVSDDPNTFSDAGRDMRDARRELADKIGEDRMQALENMNDADLAEAYRTADKNIQALMKRWMLNREMGKVEEDLNTRSMNYIGQFKEGIVNYFNNPGVGEAQRQNAANGSLTLVDVDGNPWIVLNTSGRMYTIKDVNGNAKMVDASQCKNERNVPIDEFVLAQSTPELQRYEQLANAFNGTDKIFPGSKYAIMGDGQSFENAYSFDAEVLSVEGDNVTYRMWDYSGDKPKDMGVQTVTKEQFRDMHERFLSERDKRYGEVERRIQEGVDDLAEIPVSKMLPGESFPVAWDGQLAVANVNDVNGIRNITITDAKGNVLVEDTRDITDEQWEALRSMAAEMENAPQEVVEETPKEEKAVEETPKVQEVAKTAEISDEDVRTLWKELQDVANPNDVQQYIAERLLGIIQSGEEGWKMQYKQDIYDYALQHQDDAFAKKVLEMYKKTAATPTIETTAKPVAEVVEEKTTQPEAKAEPVVETKEEPREKTVEQRLGEFSAKHGANTQNKLENTVKSIKKDIESLTKQIADAEEKLNNMPEPYDTKTQKAQEQQEKKIAKLQKEFQEKQDALAPFVELLEEYDRQATEKQGVLNKANEALQSLDENMKLYSEAPQQETPDREPTNKHEFVSTYLGSFAKAKNRLNRESLKAAFGWSDSDLEKFTTMISNEGGQTVDELSELIFAEAQDQYPSFFKDYDDVKSTIKDVMTEAGDTGSVDTYIKDRRVGTNEEQVRLDYEAQQLGYEDAADMRKKRMADAQQKLESLKDENGFITEEGLKEFQDYVEGLKIKEAPAQAETTALNEQVAEAGLVNPTETDVPFSVAVDYFQKRFADANTVEDRAKVIGEYLDTIKTEDVTILTDDDFADVLRSLGAKDRHIEQVKEAFDETRRNNQRLRGFNVPNVGICIHADDIISIDDARKTYIHERQHDITKNDVYLHGTTESVRGRVEAAADVKELQGYVAALSGVPFYDDTNHDTLADEFISMAMEVAYSTDDVVAALKERGIENNELTNIIKSLDNEQRTERRLSKARQGRGSALSGNELGRRDNQQNGGNPQGESQGVGRPRPRPSKRSQQETQGRESGGEVSPSEAEESAINYSVVSSPRKIAALEAGDKIKVYRAMQLVDGKLYPPMAGKINGKWQDPIELGVWEQADEHPELADDKGYFKLDKGNGKSLKARYNPYIHTSRSPLNDQFTSAYDRPNLVTVEVEVPASELTSGYKAEKAKNAVGETSWHSGPVAGQLNKIGKPRVVVLSRYDKPIRIVPDSEVAQHIAETLKGTGISIPYNVVTPSLRAELEKAGVEVTENIKGNVKEKKSTQSVDNEDLFVNLLNEKGEINNERLNESIRHFQDDPRGIFRVPAPKGGRKVETPSIAAQVIGRGVFEANRRKIWQDDNPRVKTRLLIKQWAQNNGYWYDDARLLEGTKEVEGGRESRVFYSEDRTFVRKQSKPVLFYGNSQPMLESIVMFGDIFERTAYTVKGFSENKDGDLCLVVEQPFVSGQTLKEAYGDDVETSDKLIRNYMSSLGFKEYGRGRFINLQQGVEVRDLHRKNVIIDANGDLFVIDALVKSDASPVSDDVMFSVSAKQDADYKKAVESGDMTKAQEMVDEAAERAGYTIRGYHGTTHLFTIFDKSKGNAEGNWGKGFYFTNNEDDANSNYATSEGPDLNSRIELMAEQMEWMDGYEDMNYEQRKEEARKILDGGQQRIISAALHMENPLVIGGNSDMQETYFDYNEEYDEENDEYGEPSGLLVDFADAWNDVINSFEWDAFSNLSASEILEYGFYGGLTASQLEDKAREVLDSHGIQNYDGNMATGDFLRQVFERMGFDGIVDSRVNIKFGTQRRYGKSMEGMDYGSLHFIVNEPNQIKQTDPVTYDDNGDVIPLSQRFNSDNNDIRYSVKNNSQKVTDDKQLSLFLQNNSGEYETQDGEKVGFTSILGLTEDVLSAGEQASAGRRDDIQREGSPLSYKLRRLEPGETCHVERRFQESKQFDFTGSDNIETADDVAYIFKQLEDAAVENSFIVLVKDGKPTIIHTGMGGYTGTYAESGGGIVAYKHINPDKVWFIHNHPSGEIQSSEIDRKTAKNIRTIFGNKFKGGIIIDTVSGHYGLFDEYSDAEIGSTKNIPDNETELKVYEFSKQVFDKDWNPQTAFPAQSSKDIAAFISSHRLGEHDKMSLLVLNNKNKVVGNVFLPYTEISDDTADKIADEALYYANQIGGTAVIIYGNFALNYIKPRNIDGIKKKINAQSRLLDIISSDRDVTYYESASEQNMLNNETEPYNGIRFSVSGEQSQNDDGKAVTEDELKAYKAGTLSTKEVVAKTLAEAAAKNKDDANKRLVAINAISKNLHDLALNLRQMSRGTDKLSKRAESNIRGAVSGIEKATADYDKATIDQIVRLSKILMDSKLFKDFSNYEVRRLLAVTRDAAGSKDITKQAEKVVDIMLDHALKEAESIFENQMKIQGSKVGTNGVEVQGKLDVAGQRMMKDLKEAMKLSDDALAARMAEVQDNLGSEDQIVADNAAIEMQALQITQQYKETIAQSEADEAELRRQVEVAKENGVKGKALKELKESVNEAVMKNKADRLDAYLEITKKLGGEIFYFMNRAKAFREKEIQRVRDIQHNANSDLEGKSASEHSKASKFADIVNSSLVRFFMKPLATFNEMLQLFGSKSVNGRGYLFNRFMPQWQKALEDSTGNFRKDCDELGAKVSEVMGKKMRWSDLFSIERKMPTINVKFLDDGEMTDHEMSQGQALYIYMVNKMTDGKMKLRAMGITEEDVERITKEIDPRFIELADWVQDEYLPRKRNDFNAVHERMFGAPMADIEDYFPLEINSRSRGQVEDISKQDIGDTKPSTTTGSIIKRKVNTIALDLTNADAFNVLLGHLQDMEHWAAYAEFNRDLNTLLSYKRFKNRVLNMESVRYGAGDALWKNFKDAAAIAADVYHPMVNRQSLDTAAVNISKGVTSAKIAFRAYTALKQLLSYPAYFGEANVWDLAKNTVRPARAFNWALDELPGFEERWRSRQAGDSRLKDTDVDWDFWKNKIVDTARRWGMTPNAFVDGLTVAMGARAIYETKYHQFKKDGLSDADAKKKALSEASVAYNETQQSSQNAYLSAMQLDRTVASVALTVFRNASMGYQRKFLRSIDNLKRKVTIGKKEMIDFMTKQGVREGLSEEQAKKAAERAWKRSWYQDAINIILFGWVMQFAWNLGSHMAYLIGGDDDNEKEAMLEDAAMHAVAGPIEGLTGGSVVSEVYNMARSGQKISNYQFNLLPIIGDIQTTVKHLEQDKIRGLNDIVNLVIQAGVGVNPQTITDVVAAIVDATNGDMETGKEVAMLMMRIAQVPQSQLDKLYIDELGLSAADAKKLSTEQLAKRYAAYKVHRDTPLTGWMYSEEGREEAEDRYVKRFEKLIQERVSKMDDEDLERNMEGNDVENKNLIGKEIANRMGTQDIAGHKPSTNWNEDTKRGHIAYQRLRTYRDVVEDNMLNLAEQEADELYEQALKDGDMEKAKEYEKRADKIKDVRLEIRNRAHNLGKKGGEKDNERMEKIRAYRKKKMQDLGIK